MFVSLCPGSFQLVYILIVPFFMCLYPVVSDYFFSYILCELQVTVRDLYAILVALQKLADKVQVSVDQRAS